VGPSELHVQTGRCMTAGSVAAMITHCVSCLLFANVLSIARRLAVQQSSPLTLLIAVANNTHSHRTAHSFTPLLGTHIGTAMGRLGLCSAIRVAAGCTNWTLLPPAHFRFLGHRLESDEAGLHTTGARGRHVLEKTPHRFIRRALVRNGVSKRSSKHALDQVLAGAGCAARHRRRVA